MSVTQNSTSDLIHVTKPSGHSPLQNYKQQHLSKTQRRRRTIIHVKIRTTPKVSPIDNRKMYSTRLPQKPPNKTKKSNKTSTSTENSSINSTNRQWKNNSWYNECNSNSTLVSNTNNDRKRSWPQDWSQITGTNSNFKSFTDHSTIFIPPSSTRNNYRGTIRDTTDQNKKKHKRQCIGSWYCWLLCTCCVYLLAAVAITALLVGLLIKSKPVSSTTISSIIFSELTSSSTSSTTTTSSTTLAMFDVNLITNGDAETGPCSTGLGLTHPTGWNYNGSMTQVRYNTSVVVDQSLTTPGPTDRGQCYFYGQISASTTMWQTINLTNYIDSNLIDTQTVNFNLSAWIGGYQEQDDRALVSLLFIDQFNQIIGNGTSIGPVLGNDRGNQTSLIFRQTTGVVPAAARFLTVVVTIIRSIGTYNDGCIDNIGLYLY